MFQIASGSVMGTHHALAGRNNQDSACCLRWEGGLVAVVCDGCSGGSRSEVGACLGARLVCQAVRRHADDRDWDAISDEVLGELRQLGAALGDDLAAVVHEYFLFTIVGALLLPEESWLFALGDGCLRLNGEPLGLGPFADNAPPYLGYRLLDPADPAALAIRPLRRLPTAEVRTLFIGSDGAADLTDPDELFCDDVHFRNPDGLRRTLYRKRRLLRDDTTLVLVRR